MNDYLVIAIITGLIVAALWSGKPISSLVGWFRWPAFTHVETPTKGSDISATTANLLLAYDAAIRASDFARSAKISAILNEEPKQ